MRKTSLKLKLFNQKIEPETFRNSQNHKNHWIPHWFPGPQSTPKNSNKPRKVFFLVFLVEFQLYFTGFLKVYIRVLLLKKYLTSKIGKNISHGFFSLFYKPPDLGKKIFTTWNVVKSKVYLTCINFWKFHDDLKACLEVIRLPSWPENVEFSVKMQFFTFLTMYEK